MNTCLERPSVVSRTAAVPYIYVPVLQVSTRCKAPLREYGWHEIPRGGGGGHQAKKGEHSLRFDTLRIKQRLRKKKGIRWWVPRLKVRQNMAKIGWNPQKEKTRENFPLFPQPLGHHTPSRHVQNPIFVRADLFCRVRSAQAGTRHYSRSTFVQLVAYVDWFTMHTCLPGVPNAPSTHFRDVYTPHARVHSYEHYTSIF